MVHCKQVFATGHSCTCQEISRPYYSTRAKVETDTWFDDACQREAQPAGRRGDTFMRAKIP